MNEETKIQDTELETGVAPPKITVKYSTLVEGIGIVFTGVAKMLSALDASTAHLVAEAGDALREQREEQKPATMTERQDTEVAEKSSDVELAGKASSEETTAAVKSAEDDTPPWEEPVAAVVTGQPEMEKSAEETAEPKKSETPAITQDDITKIIVRKLKQNRANNTKSGAILKAHGVARVSDLPESKYEAFLTDLSQI